MDDVEEYQVIIEYGEKELMDCLKNFLVSFDKKREDDKTEIEITAPVR